MKAVSRFGKSDSQTVGRLNIGFRSVVCRLFSPGHNQRRPNSLVKSIAQEDGLAGLEKPSLVQKPNLNFKEIRTMSRFDCSGGSPLANRRRSHPRAAAVARPFLQRVPGRLSLIAHG